MNIYNNNDNDDDDDNDNNDDNDIPSPPRWAPATEVIIYGTMMMVRDCGDCDLFRCASIS